MFNCVPHPRDNQIYEQRYACRLNLHVTMNHRSLFLKYILNLIRNALQCDQSCRLKPPVDLVRTLPAAGRLHTAWAGWQNIANLSQQEAFTVVNGHPVQLLYQCIRRYTCINQDSGAHNHALSSIFSEQDAVAG